MKKLLLILLASVFFISCRKEYTCDCIDLAGDPETKTIKASTKANAERKCENNPANLLKICVLRD